MTIELKQSNLIHKTLTHPPLWPVYHLDAPITLTTATLLHSCRYLEDPLQVFISRCSITVAKSGLPVIGSLYFALHSTAGHQHADAALSNSEQHLAATHAACSGTEVIMSHHTLYKASAAFRSGSTSANLHTTAGMQTIGSFANQTLYHCQEWLSRRGDALVDPAKANGLIEPLEDINVSDDCPVCQDRVNLAHCLAASCSARSLIFWKNARQETRCCLRVDTSSAEQACLLK